jgi:hypothetical protein
MKITCYFLSVLLASAMFSVHETSQATKSPRSAEERGMFGTHRLWSKGGIGMINKHLYIVVKSAENERNELVVKPTEETEERWHGKNVTEAEVAIFYEGKVWTSQSLPDGFDLSKAIVISFESGKVRFFDFLTMSGGYYERIAD